MPRLPVRHDWPRVVLLLRVRCNQSQVEFANDVSCSPSAVSKWERGETVPAPRYRRLIADLGDQVGFPAEDWPAESRQERLFE